MIGILTFHETNNFGAYLQALALYKKVQEMGLEVEIIDYRNDVIFRNEILNLKPGINLKRWLRWGLYDRKLNSKFKNLNAEFKGLVNLSSEKYTSRNKNLINDQYDTILVGSDQVWALNVTDYDYTYFLDFVKPGIRKLAFSSSISNEDLFRNDSMAQSLLSSFDNIAVREEQARDVIIETTNQDVEWVADPTLLLDSRQWDELLNPESIEGDYVLIYFVDPKRKIFNDALKYAQENNCKVVYCGLSLHRGISSICPQTMAEWVGLIKHCKAIFTASYHGLLFGLNYEKPLVFYNRNQKSRMESIARLCGIEANNGDYFNNGNIPEIDYNRIRSRLDTFRSYSLGILENMLNSR